MIINFFKKHYDKNNIETKRSYFRLGIIYFTFSLLIFFASIVLKLIFPNKAIDNNIIENGEAVNIYSLSLFLLLAAIMEEFKYRGLLTKYNFKLILISLSIIIVNIVFLIFNVKVFYISPKTILPVLEFFFKIIGLVFITYQLLKTILERHQKYLKEKFDKNFNLIVIFQAIVFGLWHVLFSGQTAEIHYVSLFILTSLYAMFYSYVRINHGLFFSIAIHFFDNFLKSAIPIILLH